MFLKVGPLKLLELASGDNGHKEKNKGKLSLEIASATVLDCPTICKAEILLL